MADWPYLGNSRIEADDLATSGTGSYEVNVDAPGSPNTKSGFVQLVASLPFSISGLMIESHHAVNAYHLVDIAIGAAGSEFVVFADIAFGLPVSGGNGVDFRYIPISVPGGTRISLRHAASAGSSFGRFKMQLLGDAFAGIQAPSRWATWNADAANSRGGPVTSGGSNNVKGSWVQLVASVPFTTKWFAFSMQGATSPRDFAVDFGIGGAGSEVVIIPDVHYTIESLSNFMGPFPLSIPAGARLSARCQVSAAQADALVIAHGGG
jgi:hypothetical protein